MVTSHVTIVQYQNQEIDIYTMCVYSFVILSRLDSCNHHHS